MECNEEFANGKDPFEKLNTSYVSHNDLSQLDYSSCLNSWVIYLIDLKEIITQ